MPTKSVAPKKRAAAETPPPAATPAARVLVLRSIAADLRSGREYVKGGFAHHCHHIHNSPKKRTCGNNFPPKKLKFNCFDGKASDTLSLTHFTHAFTRKDFSATSVPWPKVDAPSWLPLPVARLAAARD
jgi:hypothetical protein